MHENCACVEKSIELQASTKWNAKNLRETPAERGVSKWQNFVKESEFLAVHHVRRMDIVS